MNWREVPFFRLTISFIIGILFGDQLSKSDASLGLTVGVAAGLLVLLFWNGRSVAYHYRRFFGGLLLLLFSILGCLVTCWRHPLNDADYFAREVREGGVVAGVVRRVEATGEWQRALLRVQAVCPGSCERWNARSGRLLVYLKNISSSIGDTLLLRGTWSRVAPPANPEAFDYASYLAGQKIYYQGFFRSGRMLRAAPGRGFSLRRLAERWRRYGLEQLDRHLPEAEAYAFAAALVLGYKSALEQGQEQAYARAGAMHILAVSGLHVGIVYLVLSFLLNLFPQGGWASRLVQLAIQLLGVWFFVLIAGLPASAVRAATMFSFFSFGRVLSRQVHPVNFLAASAFFMLFFKPSLIFDVGFQLSYSAVLGILCLQGPLYRSWYIPGRLPRYVWQLSSVSLAAQWATFPLGLYYFHQFPLLFLLSGLVAVPAASLILGGGLMLLCCGSIPVAGDLIGTVLYGLIRVVNWAIHGIADLPGSHLAGIWIDEWGAVLWYGVVIFSALILLRKRSKYVLAALSFLLAVLVLRAFETWTAAGRQEVVVYSVSGQTVVDFLDGRHHYYLADSIVHRRQERFAAQNYRWSCRPAGVISLQLGQTHAGPTLRYRHGLLQFYGFRMFFMGPEVDPATLPELEVDLLLIRGDPPVPAPTLFRRVRAGLWVADGSNNARTAAAWEKYVQSAGQPFHSVRQSGALRVDLKRNRLLYLPQRTELEKIYKYEKQYEKQ